MIFARDRTQLAEDLARMMEELCAPELTLDRAEVLRTRVDRLLETLREPNDRPRAYPFGGESRIMGSARNF